MFAGKKSLFRGYRYIHMHVSFYPGFTVVRSTNQGRVWAYQMSGLGCQNVAFLTSDSRKRDFMSSYQRCKVQIRHEWRMQTWVKDADMSEKCRYEWKMQDAWGKVHEVNIAWCRGDRCIGWNMQEAAEPGWKGLGENGYSYHEGTYRNRDINIA